jgi:hypothetical protein
MDGAWWVITKENWTDGECGTHVIKKNGHTILAAKCGLNQTLLRPTRR